MRITLIIDYCANMFVQQLYSNRRERSPLQIHGAAQRPTGTHLSATTYWTPNADRLRTGPCQLALVCCDPIGLSACKKPG
jgi:hypothetical protein